MKHHQKAVLREKAEFIAENYKGLSIDCLLCHFREGRPTLKDVSCLVAMTIKLFKMIDAGIYKCTGPDDVKTWLRHYGLDVEIDKVTRETAPDKEKVRASLERFFNTRAPQLADPYFTFVFGQR